MQMSKGNKEVIFDATHSPKLPTERKFFAPNICINNESKCVFGWMIINNYSSRYDNDFRADRAPTGLTRCKQIFSDA